MPEFEAAYRYTTVHYDSVIVFAEDEEEARDVAFNEAELPWNFEEFEIESVDEV